MNAVESISKELDENGYAVLREIGDKEVIRQARLDLMDLLSAVPFGDNEFIGRKTKRLHSLFGQTRSIDSLAIDSLVLSVVNSYLGDVILGASVACQIYPDEDNQTFHYDDGVYPLSDKFREVKLGVVWAIDDFTIKNGATRIIPKSHGDRSKYPDDANHIQIEMPAGSALIYLGSLWHAGGENKTEFPRLGVILQYIESWLRPQDSHLISVQVENARSLDPQLRALLGYSMREPFLGYVDGRDPKYLFE